jgi:apolipoprotein N-acyltransferase
MKPVARGPSHDDHHLGIERALGKRPYPAIVPIDSTTRAVVPLWAAIVLALASGPVLDAAHPDRGWWPLILVGVGLQLVALIGRGPWTGALVGFVGLGSFYLLHIEWASMWVGPIPMVALAFLMAVGGAVGGAVIALAYRWVPRQWPSTAGRLAALPACIAGLWTAREALASVFPYGGFAWGRLAQSQSESPVSPLFAWVGISGVTFLLVLLVAVVIESVRIGGERVSGVPWFARIAAPVGLAAMMLAWPAWPVATTGTMTIAVIQGAGPAGYFNERSPGDLIAAQVAATRPLYPQVASGELDVDLVLWPEGGSDWDPLRDEYTAEVWTDVSRRMEAPLLAQATTVDEEKPYNTLILWDADADADSRALDRYDKRHPVPFGEYVPERSFFEAIAPDLIGMIGREYTPGTTDAVMDIGGVVAAVNICYDIVDDDLLRESVLDGGRIILASSNTADFGYTDESVQQLAFARIRAIELGRSVVNASTVGITAIIAPDGTITAKLPWYEAGTIVADVPLADTITPAASAGRQVEIAVGALGVGILMAAGALVLLDRRAERAAERAADRPSHPAVGA